MRRLEPTSKRGARGDPHTGSSYQCSLEKRDVISTLLTTGSGPEPTLANLHIPWA